MLTNHTMPAAANDKTKEAPAERDSSRPTNEEADFDDDTPGKEKITNASVVYRAQADMLYKGGEFSNAEAAYTKAIENNPKDRDSLTSRAECRMHLGTLELAQADVDQALKVSPNFPAAMMVRGELYYRMGEFEAALIAYHHGFRLHSQDHRFRLKAQQVEETLIQCLTRDIPELTTSGDLEVFYREVPDGRPDSMMRSMKSKSRANLASAQSSSALLCRAQSVTTAMRQPPQPVIPTQPVTTWEDDEPLPYSPDGLQFRALERRSAQLQPQMRVKIESTPAMKLEQAKCKQIGQRLTAQLLGSFNLDRRFCENLLVDPDLWIPPNIVFIPHNEEIRREARHILQFLEERRHFSIKSKPGVIQCFKKHLGSGSNKQPIGAM